MIFRNIGISFIIALFTACSSGPGDVNDLVGIYAVQENGVMKDFLKVERQGTKYLLSEKRGGKWRDKKSTLKIVTAEDFKKLLKRDVTEPFTGLMNKHLAIFQVPKGWKEKEFSTATGYFMFFMFGPVELHKTN